MSGCGPKRGKYASNMPNNTSVFRFGGLPFPAGRRIGPALCFLLLLAWSCPWAVSAAPADPPRAPSTVYASSPSLAPGAITVHPYGQMQQSDSLDDYDTAPVDSISMRSRGLRAPSTTRT